MSFKPTAFLGKLMGRLRSPAAVFLDFFYTAALLVRNGLDWTVIALTAPNADLGLRFFFVRIGVRSAVS